jgi:iron complex outermembrane receptor protein
LATPAFGQAEPPQATPEAAKAQDATGELAPDNEIVVTARRRSESVQDVPQTVNVVTAAQVEKLNLRSFQDIASIVPGLTMTQTSSFSSQATVRGVAFVPEASGNNPSVEFYLNDAPISSGFLFQSTYDFGQFELQRGPQGTLRGRASPSGSIAVTSRRPDLDEIGFVANATATDLKAYKFDGALNIPIIKDMLALRLAGVLDYNEGNRVHSIKKVSDPRDNKGPYRRTQSYRASVRFQPTDWITANVMYQRLHSEDHSFAQVVSDSLISGAAATTPIIHPFDRLSLDDQGSFGRQDHKVLIGNLDVRFAGQKLSYVGSYNKQDFGSLGPQDNGDFFSPPRVNLVQRAFADPAGFEAVCVGEGLEAGIQPTTGTFYQCTHGQGTRKSHELRLASDKRIGGIFDYVVGALYDHNDNPVNLTQETPIVNTNTGNITTVSRTAIVRKSGSTEKSVFGNLTAHLGHFELSGGLRHIDYRSHSSLQQGAVVTNTQRDHDHATVYLASAKYQITRDVMVYALTGSSWRPGPRVVGDFSVGPNGTSGPSALERQFTDLPPERSKSYEIGAKTSFLNGRGRFNLSAYYQKFKDYPFRGPSVAFVNYRLVNGVATPEVGTFNFVSPVPVTVKGVEAEASFQILRRWSVGANVAYSDGRIKGGTIACTDLDRNGVPDTNATTPTLPVLQAALPPGQTLAVCPGISRRALTSPKFSANLQSEFGFALAEGIDGFVRGSATIFGKTQNDPANTFDDVGSYGLLNLFAGVRDKDGAWEVTLFGKNILRERQVLSVGSGVLTTSYRSPAVNTYVSQYRSISVTAPREFGITLRVATGSH